MALRPSAAAVYRNAHMEEEGNSCFSSFDGLRMSVSSDMRQDEKFARALLHPYLKPAAIALALLGGLILWLGIALGGGILAFAWMTSIFSLLLAANLVSRIFQEDVSACGAMLAIASAIRQGANGFLLTQYAAIARFFTFLSLVLFLVYFLRPPSSIADTTPLSRAFITALSFLIGGGCSAFAGWVGVWISVRCNIRVAAAAARQSSGDALKIAFNGGAVASLISAALCIVGICLLYSGCYLVFVSSWSYSPTVLPMLLTGYGFGASFVALFMQLGGGIYTKAADVGADLIGKIEAGIPEDDPRNPAVIADLVGDNVGDCAGSMADVFESIAAEVIGTMILGAELAHGMPNGAENSHCFILFPLIVHSMDMIVSSVGIWLVSRASESQCSEPLAVMRRAYAVTAILSIFGLFLTTRFVLYVPTAPHAWFWFFCCGIVGVITAFLLVLITQYYTDYAYAPVQSIAAASVSGHATNIIAGVSVGFISTAAPSVVICSAVLSSYHFGARSGVLPAATAGEFGVAIACMGMLGTAVFVLSMNNFGPIADNAGGIVEMGGCDPSTRAITDRLDAVGNVTKAATKGYAVGGSALACFILFRAYLGEMARVSGVNFESVNIAHVECLVGGILGIMLVFLFTGLTVASVGRAAQEVVKEVRRQFAEHPGILLPNSQETPNYGECVAIVTRAAHREMLLPAVLALGLPVAVGIVFRVIGTATSRPMLAPEVLGSFMVFSSFTGLMMAMFLDNSGGAWDNAKKYIEANNHGGKGSAAHKAAVTGDTVGDPFKDTAGPSLHVIITTMATTIIVLGPLFIGPLPSL